MISSDHRPIIFSLTKNKTPNITWKAQINWNKHYNQILRTIQTINNPTISEIQKAFQTHCTTTIQKSYTIKTPKHWYKPSSKVKKLLKTSKHQKRTRDPHYHNTAAQLRKAIRQDKKQQFKSFLYQTNKEMNSRNFYTRIRHLKFPKPWTTDPAQDNENTLLSKLNHDSENTYQQTQLTLDRLKDYNAHNPQTFEPFTLSDLTNILTKLPTRKAPGWDGIPYEFWAKLPKTIHQHILNDINLTLMTGEIPPPSVIPSSNQYPKAPPLQMLDQSLFYLPLQKSLKNYSSKDSNNG
jgi:hypothetical protein